MRPISAWTDLAAPLLVGVAVFGVLAAWGLWSMTASAIPQAKIRQVRIGMGADAVRRFLGPPTAVYVDPGSGTTTWTYSRWTWAIYYVEVGPEGVVVEHHHDY